MPNGRGLNGCRSFQYVGQAEKRLRSQDPRSTRLRHCRRLQADSGNELDQNENRCDPVPTLSSALFGEEIAGDSVHCYPGEGQRWIVSGLFVPRNCLNEAADVNVCSVQTGYGAGLVVVQKREFGTPQDNLLDSLPLLHALDNGDELPPGVVFDDAVPQLGRDLVLDVGDLTPGRHNDLDALATFWKVWRRLCIWCEGPAHGFPAEPAPAEAVFAGSDQACLWV